MLKKINIKINGIHCASCKTLIETEIDVLPGVKSVFVDYQSGETSVEFENEKITEEKIFEEIKKLNYGVETGLKNKEERAPDGSFWSGLLIPLILGLIIGGYFLAKQFGGFEMFNELNSGKVSYGFIFLIGLLASFHCIGMCGGIVLSYSAGNLQKEKGKILAPHFYYNAGRLISYSIIGAILGGIGSFFGVNPYFTGVIMALAGAFMVLMGLSFLGKFSILEKIKLRTPQFIARYLYNQKHGGKSRGPFVIGLLNGFMPCGPLQAMQLYALASGSAARGGLSMAIYALGTIPLMLGFGALVSTFAKEHIGKIMKVSGILIVVLGLLMVNRGLVNFGYGFRGFSSGNNSNNQNSISNNEEFQTVKMELNYFGYKPNVLYIKKGVPVRWVIDVKEMTGCTNAIMIESLGIKKDLKKGENIIEFTPPPGVKEINFSCWMKMVWGKFVITDSDPQGGLDFKSANAAENNAPSLPSGGCGCGGGANKNNSNGAATGSCH